MVLLFKSTLKLSLGKLKSQWPAPFKVTKVQPNGAVETWSESTGAFTVNG